VTVRNAAETVGPGVSPLDRLYFNAFVYCSFCHSRYKVLCVKPVSRNSLPGLPTNSHSTGDIHILIRLLVCLTAFNIHLPEYVFI